MIGILATDKFINSTLPTGPDESILVLAYLSPRSPLGPPQVHFQELGETIPILTELLNSLEPSTSHGLFLNSHGCHPMGNKINRIFN